MPSDLTSMCIDPYKCYSIKDSMEGDYLYLVYRDDAVHTVDIVAKIGKGRKNRYRSYTTPYGSGYKVYIVYPERDYSVCERELLLWCRSKGYLKDGAEVVTMMPRDGDTWRDLKARHMTTINSIKQQMSTYGPAYEAGIKDRKWYHHQLTVSPPTQTSPRYERPSLKAFLKKLFKLE